MTRSQLDRIEESGHSALTTPQHEKRLGLNMSDNTATPTAAASPSSLVLPPNHLTLPNNNHHMESKSSNQVTYSGGMGVPLLAQLPLSAVGEINKYDNEFPFHHATPNEWAQDEKSPYYEVS
jgi:hypothetical protein